MPRSFLPNEGDSGPNRECPIAPAAPLKCTQIAGDPEKEVARTMARHYYTGVRSIILAGELSMKHRVVYAGRQADGSSDFVTVCSALPACSCDVSPPSRDTFRVSLLTRAIHRGAL